MNKKDFDCSVWIVYFIGLDVGGIEPCNMNAFRSKKAALAFSKREMRKKWPESDEAVGRTASDRDAAINTALEQLQNGEEAQVADHQWTMFRLTVP